ncbi:hypothetical protein D3C74_370010 [compost metagenome]
MIGKKVTYAAITIRAHSALWMMPYTIGARPITGTICEETIYGDNVRSSHTAPLMSRARPRPSSVPPAKPMAALPNVTAPCSASVPE